MKTPLYDEHRALGGRMIDFGGWELPVQYEGIAAEHHACRTTAAIFDVSHMGEFWVEGSGAEAFLDFAVTNAVSKTVPGQAQYTVMCLESGGIVDDLIIYRRDATRFLVVVNASNIEKDFQHLQKVLSIYESAATDRKGTVQLDNISNRYAQLALQGPRAREILAQLYPEIEDLKTFRFLEKSEGKAVPTVLARTGYTGEDGFEIYLDPSLAVQVWRSILETGSPLGLKPAGLGARDTLRLESRYPLYGQELSETIHPLEAGLSWVVKFEKSDFLGKGSLLKIKEKGLARKLVGFELVDPGIARHGYAVCQDTLTNEVGEVTSGTQSPTLGKAIGLAYVPLALASTGSDLKIRVRERLLNARVIETPFYKRTA